MAHSEDDEIEFLRLLTKSSDRLIADQAQATLDSKLAIPDVEKAGPHGYIHGWHFVGIPAIGSVVHHPDHGTGTVTGHSQHGHTWVHFGPRRRYHFQNTGQGNGTFQARHAKTDKLTEHLDAAAAAAKKKDHATAAQEYRNAADQASHPQVKQNYLDRAAKEDAKAGGTLAPRASKPARTATAAAAAAAPNTQAAPKTPRTPSVGPKPYTNLPAAPAAPAKPAATGIHELDRFIEAKTDADKHNWLGAAYNSVVGLNVDPKHKDAFEAARKAVETDPNVPGWLKTVAFLHGKDAGKVDPGVYAALRYTADRPQTGKTINLHQAERLFEPDANALAALPPHIQDAVNQKRSQAVIDVAKDDYHAGKLAEAVFPGLASAKDIDTSRADALDPTVKLQLRDSIEKRMAKTTSNWTSNNSNDYIEASLRQRAIDHLDGNKLDPNQRRVADLGHSFYDRTDVLDAAEKIHKQEFDALAKPHREKLTRLLAHHGMPTSSSPQARVQAKVMRDELERLKGQGVTIKYPHGVQRDAMLAALRDKDMMEPGERLDAYLALSGTHMRGLGTDRQVIEGDLATLAAPRSGLTDDKRFIAQQTLDRLQGHGYHADVENAIAAANPMGSSDAFAVNAFNKVTKAQYDALPDAFRTAVDTRVDALQAASPAAYQALKTKFDPTWAPPQAPHHAVTQTTDPKVQAALDVIYGTHPKANQNATILSAYGALKQHQFNQLSPAEQQHVLGDLSYVATTSKYTAHADRAKRYLHNFTPAGTPFGQANGTAIPPVNAIPGQHRYTDPAGVPGLLKEAKDSGVRGDEWITLPSGRRVWGKYGAGGVMLRHVDSGGQERFLMVQRGPAISDPGKWSFPGGAFESKETPLEGATREVREELGFKKGDLEAARVHGHFEAADPSGQWKYTSVAATVPTMMQPDLSTAHARAETSDAKWMTRKEIEDLDKAGKLHAPVAGGQLDKNVLSLFPAQTTAVHAPGPVTVRPGRLNPALRNAAPGTPANAKPHKVTKAKDLLTDKTAIDTLRQQIKQDRVKFDGKTADGRLAAIGALQGHHDTPTVVSKKEMDRLLKTGDYIEVWRGVKGTWGGKSAADINEEFRSGPAWYGKGIFGNGYYFATDRSVVDGKWSRYNDGTKNSVLRALIPKSALTVRYPNAQTEAQKIASPRSKAKGNKYEDGTLYDPGRWAAAKGYDGIEVQQHDYSPSGGASHVAKHGKPAYNWLNRSVMIVQEADK